MSLETWKNHLVCYHCGGYCVARAPQDPFADDDRMNPFERCPSLVKYRFKTNGARGRLTVARALAWGNVPVDADIAKHAYGCTTCGVCDVGYCAMPEVKTEIYRAVRERVCEAGQEPQGSRAVNEAILRKRNWFGEDASARTDWARGLDLPSRGEVLYFPGCAYSYRFPRVARATVEILRSAGVDVATLGDEEVCCGAHAYWSGETRVAGAWAKHDTKAIAQAGAKTVIFSCPLCYRTMKRDYAKMGTTPAFAMRHVTEVVADLIADGRLVFKHARPAAFTYHDPCSLGRDLGIYDEPRRVLSSIPGVTVSEMDRHRRWSWCCGSGSTVTKSSNPELARWTAEQRLREARRVGSEIATACPWCVDNLTSGGDVGVHDLMVLVAGALGTAC